MSFAAQYGCALARGAVAGLVCVVLGTLVNGMLSSPDRRRRGFAWVALLVPFLTPSLLVGYAYSNFFLSLVRHPFWNEALYDILLWMRLVPVAAVVVHFAPSPLSEEAVHCRRLLRDGEVGIGPFLSYLWFLVRGPLRASGAAFALVFLLAFGEFETASLFGISSWTVSLFDAHAGGLALMESLRLALVPMLSKLGLILLVLAILLGGRRVRAVGRSGPDLPEVARLLAWCYLAAAVLAVTVLPMGIVLRGSGLRAGTFLQSLVLAQDIGASVLFALAAAVCAYLVAGWLLTGARYRGLVWAFCLSAPGLVGPLVLCLLLVFLLQAPVLRAVYDTPIPLLGALCLVLLPFAAVLRVLLHVSRPGEAVHSANLLKASAFSRVRSWGRGIVWRLQTRGRFWVGYLLF